jgi:hypothetical protein
MAMRSKAPALAGFVLSALLAGAGSLLFAVARADFGNLGCRNVTPADWQGMNGDCADAAWLIWRSGPVAVLGVLGMGLTLWGMRRA